GFECRSWKTFAARRNNDDLTVHERLQLFNVIEKAGECDVAGRARAECGLGSVVGAGDGEMQVGNVVEQAKGIEQDIDSFDPIQPAQKQHNAFAVEIPFAAKGAASGQASVMSIVDWIRKKK